MALVSQLEEGSLGVHGAAQVRPERDPVASEDDIARDSVESHRSVQMEQVEADQSCGDSREEAGSPDGVAFEADDWESESTGGLGSGRGLLGRLRSRRWLLL